MILSRGKCHYLYIGKEVADNDTLKISSQYQMNNGKKVEISGMTLDRKLSFNPHTKSISKRAGQNISTLLRISTYYEDTQAKIICITQCLNLSSIIVY